VKDALATPSGDARSVFAAVTGCGRALAVDSERPVRAAEMTKARAGLVAADARVRGKALVR
jgi:hypothetical protein